MIDAGRPALHGSVSNTLTRLIRSSPNWKRHTTRQVMCCPGASKIIFGESVLRNRTFALVFARTLQNCVSSIARQRSTRRQLEGTRRLAQDSFEHLARPRLVDPAAGCSVAPRQAWATNTSHRAFGSACCVILGHPYPLGSQCTKVATTCLHRHHITPSWPCFCSRLARSPIARN